MSQSSETSQSGKIMVVGVYEIQSSNNIPN